MSVQLAQPCSPHLWLSCESTNLPQPCHLPRPDEQVAVDTDAMFAELLASSSSSVPAQRAPPALRQSGLASITAIGGGGSQRLDERLRSLEADESIFLLPPIDVRSN